MFRGSNLCTGIWAGAPMVHTALNAQAMSGLAKHTLETAAKHASYSCVWSDGSGSAIIQLWILNTKKKWQQKEKALKIFSSWTENKIAKHALKFKMMNQFFWSVAFWKVSKQYLDWMMSIWRYSSLILIAVRKLTSELNQN